MTEHHPMVPPNILLNNWESDWFAEREHADVLLTQAYQAGADAELEACCEVLKDWGSCLSPDLRAARRPKPSPFQEQSVVIAELKNHIETLKHQLDTLRADHLRMANAVANQLPNRSKFFVDAMKDNEPVSSANAADVYHKLAEGTFLAKDRNSNFPVKNTDD